MSKAAVSLRSIHVCDNVSRDNRGLPSLHGIYPDRVRCISKPCLVQLTLFAAFEVLDQQFHAIEFLIDGPGSKGSGGAEISEGAKYFDLDATMLFYAREEGRIEVRWRADGGRWNKGATWNIVFEDEIEPLDDDASNKLRRLFKARIEAMELIDESRTAQANVRY